MMTREVTMETIYEEIGHVRAQLREEAEELVSKATAEPAKAVAAGVADSSAAATAVALRQDEAAPLRNFFEQQLKPFLENPGSRKYALGNEAQSRTAFVQLRTLVPPALHSTLDDLENICEEERQLTLQSQLHAWLHGWLLLHIPLSFALLLRGAVHAAISLRY
jgi:hypothetical protein